jgi:DNA-binding winged helix-turn-helix (wHTH) protein
MSNNHAMGPYLLNPVAREWTRAGVVIKIGDRQFDILRVLRERPGQVVPKREVLERVWPDTLVDESALRVHISTLRRTFEVLWRTPFCAG